MRLDILHYHELLESTDWRNAHLETLRTPFMLTEPMQNEFWHEINKRDSKHRYWAIRVQRKELKEPKNNLTTNDEVFVGVGGLTNIEWENRKAEISLILSDTYQNMGLGEKAVDLLLDQGFNYMNLENIYGEVYLCNERGYKFWDKMILKHKSLSVVLPYRKFWQGKYWDSIYFNFGRKR